MTELKVEGNLLRSITKAVRACIGYGISEQEERRKAMALDMYTEFKDWLDYNYPGTELEPLQENLMKLALRNHDTKVSKVAGKAIMKKLVELIIKGVKAK